LLQNTPTGFKIVNETKLPMIWPALCGSTGQRSANRRVRQYADKENPGNNWIKTGASVMIVGSGDKILDGYHRDPKGGAAKPYGLASRPARALPPPATMPLLRLRQSPKPSRRRVGTPSDAPGRRRCGAARWQRCRRAPTTSAPGFRSGFG